MRGWTRPRSALVASPLVGDPGSTFQPLDVSPTSHDLGRWGVGVDERQSVVHEGRRYKDAFTMKLVRIRTQV